MIAARALCAKRAVKIAAENMAAIFLLNLQISDNYNRLVNDKARE